MHTRFFFQLPTRERRFRNTIAAMKPFARIANRNIRFYMQLVHESIVQQISVEKNLSEQIDCRDQTIAARRVGLNFLRELEGATARGSYLAKLILGFGRFFQLLASNPIGGAPECNQFFLKGSGKGAPSEQQEEALRLLTDAVMHLALVRSHGTKLPTESDTRAWITPRIRSFPHTSTTVLGGRERRGLLI